MVSTSNHTKCVSLDNQRYMTQHTLINLYPKEYSPELHYYLLVVNLDRYAGSCNTIDHPSGRVCVPNEREDLNLDVFNMITGINELRTLTKHISSKCEFKFDSNVTRM